MWSPPLGQALAEIERHVADEGWDQPPRLYALAATDELAEREPELADQLGLDPDSSTPGQLTPVEQELPDRSLEDLLATITWPPTVVGCAVAVERIVLPPGTEDAMPSELAEAARWAAGHPDRSEVRLVVGVLRDGTRSSVLRVRGHDDDTDLVRDPEMAPDLADALEATLTE
jgi:hypothetical protein